MMSWSETYRAAVHQIMIFLDRDVGHSLFSMGELDS